MLIPDALAQHIVDSAQAVIGCNVNIMDREGIIIGTAQPLGGSAARSRASPLLRTGRGEWTKKNPRR